MKLHKRFSLFCFCTLFCTVLFGQGIDGVTVKKKNLQLGKDIAEFTYLEIRDTLAFRLVTQKLKDTSNYPLSIIKKPVFDPLVLLVQEYDEQVDKLQMLDKHHVVLDSINQLKIAELVRLDSLQNKRIENFKTLTEELKTTNGQLSEQLKNALAVTKEANNGKIRKQLWTGVLGGAVGFSVATLIALLAR